MAIDKNEYSFFVYSWVVFLKKCVGGGGGGGNHQKVQNLSNYLYM